MAQYSSTAREEQIKNQLRQDYFKDYDATPILGNIDFAVAVPTDGQQIFETEYLLWAEAKEGTKHDIRESFAQLILTIGKEGTNRKKLPPAFLGAFDAEKIAFIQYYKVMDLFANPDINWKTTPSDHTSLTFRQMLTLVGKVPAEDFYLFHFSEDDRELRRFIKRNFVVGKRNVSKILISRNNFTFVYQKWCKEVKPTIAIDWDAAKKEKIIDADFYLADLLSSNNVSFKERLQVLLQSNRYVYNIRRKATGALNFDTVDFNDQQKAHTLFWNHYIRPPKRDFWDYMVERRDLLVPEDVREREGSFFTPPQWVDLSQRYIAMELGDDWQDRYAVWDCCAGTGNLLYGLKDKYRIFASDISEANVKAMHDRIQNGANLLDSHVFQFDFLNDSFDKLPQPLQDIIADPEQRKRLLIYINPPYAEAANKKTVTGNGRNKTDVAVNTKMYGKYKERIGIAGRELFAQFIMRVYDEIPSSVLAQFSKLKIEQAPNFRYFRDVFRAKLGRSFLVPADTFDNVTGDFPIGFFIWRTDQKERFKETVADVYDAEGEPIGHKTLCAYDDMKSINDWIITTRNRAGERRIGYMSAKGNDFQNTNYIFIINDKSQLPHPRGTWVTDKNLREIAVYFAVRHCIEPTWLNDRDQFLFPNDGWQADYEFQSDCLVYTLFNNNIQSKYGANHWIPFTEQEVDAKEAFHCHFMTDSLHGKVKPAKSQPVQTEMYESHGTTIAPTGRNNIAYGCGSAPYVPREHFSAEAKAVMDAGRELWHYYHAQPGANPDASYYDIRLHFQGTKVTKGGKTQMNADSADARYTELIGTLRQRLKALAKKIEPKVYAYGFLKR